MSLRKRTLLVISGVLVSLVLILWGAAEFILMDRFTGLEVTKMRLDTTRILEMINSELDALSRTNRDWSAWDDTYNYVKSGSLEYIKNNLDEETFVNLRLNLILITNHSGRIMFGKTFDKKENPIPDELLRSIQKTIVLFAHSTVETSVSGIFPAPQGPILMVSRPILNSQGQGPIRGTLIFGRFLDQNEIENLGEKVKQPFVVERYSKDHHHEKLAFGGKGLIQYSPVIVKALNKRIVEAHAVLGDVEGKPGFIVRISQERDIYSQGRQALFYLLLSMVIFGVVTIGVMMFGLEKWVLSRYAKLNQEIRRISKSDDASDRVKVYAHDELAQIALEINRMLSAREEIEKRYENFFKTSQDAVYITTLDGHIIDCNESMAELFGYTHEELKRTKVTSLYLGKEDRKKLSMEAEKKGVIVDYPIKLRRKDGEIRDCLINSSVWRDPETGEVVGFQGITRDVTEFNRIQREKEDLIAHLKEAVARVKTLSGLLPICASCKKIRDDKGYWRQIESYIRDHTEADFSHGICPDCFKKLYPDIEL